MTRLVLPGILFTAVACLLPAAEQNPVAQERAGAASLLVYGWPTAATNGSDAQAATEPLAGQVARERDALRRDPARQAEVNRRALRDAFGTDSAPAGAPTPAPGSPYFAQLQHYLEFLGSHPGEYRAAIDRAYELVIRRQAYPEELDYWKPHGPLPFVLLVGAIENWAVRNQPGLMVTTGTPTIAATSRFLRTQRLSPPVANEAREILGLPVWSDVARQHNPGRNVVAVAAGEIDSVGGVHFLLAGGGLFAGE